MFGYQRVMGKTAKMHVMRTTFLCIGYLYVMRYFVVNEQSRHTVV
jgi:hypothetical protein